MVGMVKGFFALHTVWTYPWICGMYVCVMYGVWCMCEEKKAIKHSYILVQSTFKCVTWNLLAVCKG